MFSEQLSSLYKETRWDYFKEFEILSQTSAFLKKGRILLGFQKAEYPGDYWLYDIDEPVYMDFPIRTPSPPAVVIIGARGGGKTSTMGNIIWQAKLNGLPVMAIDPKASLQKFKKPQENPSHLDKLASLGIKPTTLPIYTIAPMFLKGNIRYEGTDSFFSISKPDFDAIKDASFRKELIYSFLDLDPREQESGAIKMMSAWDYADNFDGLMRAMGRTSRSKAYMIYEHIKDLIKTRVWTDKKTTPPDFSELLKEYILVLQVSLAHRDMANSSTVALIIQKLRELLERKAFGEKTFLLIGEEIDVLLEPGTASRTQLEYAYSKDREIRLAPCFVLQDPRQGRGAFLQSEYVISPSQRKDSDGFNLLKQFSTSNAYASLRLKKYGLIHEQMLLSESGDRVQTYIPLITPFHS